MRVTAKQWIKPRNGHRQFINPTSRKIFAGLQQAVAHKTRQLEGTGA